MATVRKRGNSYELDWRDSSGERHKESLGAVTRSVALAALTRKKLALLGNPTASTPVETVREFSTKYLAWYRVQYPSSYDRIYRLFGNYILPKFGGHPLNMIKPYDTVKWMTELMEATAPFESVSMEGFTPATMPDRLAPESANKVIKSFKAMLNRAVDWEVIEVNPIAGKKVASAKNRSDKKPHYFLPEQLNTLYDKCAERNKWMWKAIANLGLRRQEALNLRHSHLLNGHVVIYSTNESPTKGAETRDVPLNAEAKRALKNLKELVGDETYVFPRMFPSSLSRLCKADLKRAKLPGSIHSLRHTFAANLVMAGVPLRTVQILMGHASIETTEIYAHLAPSYLKKITTKISL